MRNQTSTSCPCASGYAEGARVGARVGAPDAIQVADRFHLLCNLTDAVKRVVRAHQKCLQDQPASAAVAQPDPTQPAAPDGEPTDVVAGRRAELTRLRWAEVRVLSDKGIGTTAISRALNLDTKTVRRYARAATAEELITTMPRRGSDLDGHTAYLATRWQEGCTNAMRLTQELRERGYRGSERSVRRLLQAWRAGATPVATPTSPPTPHQVTGWIIRPTSERTKHDHAALTRIIDRCPILRVLDQLVGDFGGMLRHLHGQHLDTWIAQARPAGSRSSTGSPPACSRTTTPCATGLTLPWSSDAVEGAVARLKAVKRAMYGRANFDLLRRRVLLPT
ncbi:hypothetical protein [Pseudonocardia sp. 73-21]|uniref:hypothetical protein n=1 Tax=Pseudonocardia sp. 73-21 TaxID=1895809 RepID=UPI00262836C5|nr:hypothetical protein [Pseudonocardia sp. 73-21]